MKAARILAMCVPLLACGCQEMGTRTTDTLQTPGAVPRFPTRDEFPRLLPSEGDAASQLSQIRMITGLKAEVSVTDVTFALFQGDNAVGGCIVAPITDNASSATPIVLSQGDELVVTWMPADLTMLEDGVYSEQVTLQGSVPQYIHDGVVFGAHPQGLLVIDYRPFRVAARTLEMLSSEEYRALAFDPHEGPEGEEIAATDVTPKDCLRSDVPAQVHVVSASAGEGG